MISNTQALSTLKKQTQSVFNFSILNCYSVPFFKDFLKNNPCSVLPSPAYYKGEVKAAQLIEFAESYENDLCKYILLSSFSFFESYIKSVIQEFIDFHGGELIFEEEVYKNISEVMPRVKYRIPYNISELLTNLIVIQNGNRISIKREIIDSFIGIAGKNFPKSQDLKKEIEMILSIDLVTKNALQEQIINLCSNYNSEKVFEIKSKDNFTELLNDRITSEIVEEIKKHVGKAFYNENEFKFFLEEYILKNEEDRKFYFKKLMLYFETLQKKVKDSKNFLRNSNGFYEINDTVIKKIRLAEKFRTKRKFRLPELKEILDILIFILKSSNEPKKRYSHLNDFLDDILEYSKVVNKNSKRTKFSTKEKRCLVKFCYIENKSKVKKYLKEIKFLKQHHYLFPYEMISLYGLRKLFDELKDMKEKGKSSNIPTLLQEAFHFHHKFLHEEDILTKKTIFENIREYRHKIAHGSKKINLTIPEVNSMNRQLREIAIAFDKHLLEFFFINQRFIK